MGEFANDDARLALLATGRDEHWKALHDDMRSPFRLYFLKSTSQNPEQVNELFQDAIVVLHRKVMSGGLSAPLRSSLKTYLFGVGKMLCRKQNSQSQKWNDDIPEIAVNPIIEDQAEQQQKATLVRQLLAKLDTGCRELLTLVYIRSYSMEAVVQQMDISNEGAARKRKFDCLKKIRKMLP